MVTQSTFFPKERTKTQFLSLQEMQLSPLFHVLCTCTHTKWQFTALAPLSTFCVLAIFSHNTHSQVATS